MTLRGRSEPISPPIHDREQAVQTVLTELTFSKQDGLSLPPTYEDQEVARRIVDALGIGTTDPQTARPDGWRRERDRALERAERTEERLRAVLEAVSEVVREWDERGDGKVRRAVENRLRAALSDSSRERVEAPPGTPPRVPLNQEQRSDEHRSGP